MELETLDLRYRTEAGFVLVEIPVDRANNHIRARSLDDGAIVSLTNREMAEILTIRSFLDGLYRYDLIPDRTDSRLAKLIEEIGRYRNYMAEHADLLERRVAEAQQTLGEDVREKALAFGFHLGTEAATIGAGVLLAAVLGIVIPEPTSTVAGAAILISAAASALNIVATDRAQALSLGLLEAALSYNRNAIEGESTSLSDAVNILLRINGVGLDAREAALTFDDFRLLESALIHGMFSASFAQALVEEADGFSRSSETNAAGTIFREGYSILSGALNSSALGVALNLIPGAAGLVASAIRESDKLDSVSRLGAQYQAALDEAVSTSDFSESRVASFAEDAAKMITLGTPADEKIRGSEEADVIIGAGGFDTVTAGGGDDLVYLNSDATFADLGDGNDQIYLDEVRSGSTLRIDGGAGTDKLLIPREFGVPVLLSDDGDRQVLLINGARLELLSIEIVEDSDEPSKGPIILGKRTSFGLDRYGDDEILVGTSDSDYINGSGGIDTIFGFDGNDVLLGGGGVQNFNGCSNQEVTLSGGALYGGAGNDIFVPRSFGTTPVSLQGGTGVDAVIVYAEWLDIGDWSSDFGIEDSIIRDAANGTYATGNYAFRGPNSFPSNGTCVGTPGDQIAAGPYLFDARDIEIFIVRPVYIGTHLGGSVNNYNYFPIVPRKQVSVSLAGDDIFGVPHRFLDIEGALRSLFVLDYFENTFINYEEDLSNPTLLDPQAIVQVTSAWGTDTIRNYHYIDLIDRQVVLSPRWIEWGFEREEIPTTYAGILTDFVNVRVPDFRPDDSLMLFSDKVKITSLSNTGALDELGIDVNLDGSSDGFISIQRSDNGRGFWRLIDRLDGAVISLSSENTAPTNIYLTFENLTMPDTWGHSGTFFYTVNIQDVDEGDWHRLEILSGGDAFVLEGNRLSLRSDFLYGGPQDKPIVIDIQAMDSGGAVIIEKFGFLIRSSDGPDGLYQPLAIELDDWEKENAPFAEGDDTDEDAEGPPLDEPTTPGDPTLSEPIPADPPVQPPLVEPSTPTDPSSPPRPERPIIDERVHTGSAAANEMTGGAQSDTMSGGGGSDTLMGMGGHDMMLGEAGADVLMGGGGRDTMMGGGGRDMLMGQGGRDSLMGGGGRDTLDGGGGKDMLMGQGGKDSLMGGGGRDTLEGGGGRDVLEGGNGADRLIGGKGPDIMTGGGGRDRFVFSERDGNDSITDFQHGRDKIEFLSGAESFDDLTIFQRGSDVLIRYQGGSIRIDDDDVGNFAANDFLFN